MPIPDAQSYLTIARNLIEGHGYSLSEGPPYEPDNFRTPLYPLFLSGLLSLSGFNLLLPLVVQILLSSLTPFILLPFLKELAFAEREITLGAYLIAINPLLSFFSVLLLTETIFICLLFLSFWTEKPFLRGLIMGLAALVRPIAIFGPILLLPFHRLREFPKILIGFTFMITPWLIRNYLTSGEIQFASVSDANLLLHHAAPVIAAGEDRNLYEVQDSLKREAERMVREERVSLMRAYRVIAVRELLSHPIGYLKLLTIGLLGNFIPFPLGHWVAYVTGKNIWALKIRSAVFQEVAVAITKFRFIQIIGIVWQQRLRHLGGLGILGFISSSVMELMIIIMAIFGLFLYTRRKFPLFLWLGYFTLLPGSYGHPRFRVPVEPILIILASITIQILVDKIRLKMSTRFWVRFRKLNLL